MGSREGKSRTSTAGYGVSTLGGRGPSIGGAGSDVFDPAPPPGPSAVRPRQRGVEPHSARLSKEAAIRMAISTARNVLAGIDSTLDPAMVVNREVL
jgi:phosphoglycerate dehydrogenase-like enzyme